MLADRGINVTCSSSSTTKASTATGSIPTAKTTGTSLVSIGTVAALKLSNCTGPFGAVTITVNNLPYSVAVDSKTNSARQTDVVITGVNTSVSMKGCSFTVTGSAPGFYTNSNHTLTLTPTLPTKPLNSARLTISGVNGCASLVNNGDHPTYKGTYKVSRAIVIKAS